MRRTQPFYLGHPAKPRLALKLAWQLKKEAQTETPNSEKPDNCNPAEMRLYIATRIPRTLCVVSMCLDRRQPIGTALSFFHCLMRDVHSFRSQRCRRRVEKAKENREINHEKQTEGGACKLCSYSTLLLNPAFGWRWSGH